MSVSEKGFCIFGKYHYQYHELGRCALSQVAGNIDLVFAASTAHGASGVGCRVIHESYDYDYVRDPHYIGRR